jgi:pyruvate formate lyase activating enzyme
MRREAMHYKKLEEGKVICELCPHKCNIRTDSKGVCGVREIKNGVLETVNYGCVSSIGIDPIEKKPLYHYMPGSQILSVGSFGCNFNCGFCQNFQIAKEMPETKEISPDKLIELAIKYKEQGNIGIAFTYNEPSIWYEYVFDTSKKCKEADMSVVVVTNGYINKEPLTELLPYVDAMNIDLKAFNNDYYKKVCNGDVESVMSTIERANSSCHVEITTLLVDGYNASNEEIESLSKWLASINRDIPLHLSRYHPTYKFTEPPTKIESMNRCADIARKHLHHVYIGNLGNVDNNTYCWKCGTRLIDRSNYTLNIHMTSNKCPKCNSNINIKLTP